MNIVIIEDEQAAVRNLKSIIAEIMPNANIVAEIDSISSAIEWFSSCKNPDLVFMDIHLADGSAFEIFNKVNISSPIIFTTAYDEYAIKAFKVNSIDYLLKPIGKEDVEQAVKKYNNIYDNDKIASSIDLKSLLISINKQESYKTHFLVNVKGDKLLPVSVETIYMFYIYDSKVKILTSKGEEYIINQTLDDIIDMVSPKMFFRANRQAIVSRNAIKDIDLWFNNRLSINLFNHINREKILVSKAKVQEFKDWFSGN